jgi:hypothetical protein
MRPFTKIYEAHNATGRCAWGRRRHHLLFVACLFIAAALLAGATFLVTALWGDYLLRDVYCARLVA